MPVPYIANLTLLGGWISSCWWLSFLWRGTAVNSSPVSIVVAKPSESKSRSTTNLEARNSILYSRRRTSMQLQYTLIMNLYLLSYRLWYMRSYVKVYGCKDLICFKQEHLRRTFTDAFLLQLGRRMDGNIQSCSIHWEKSHVRETLLIIQITHVMRYRDL